MLAPIAPPAESVPDDARTILCIDDDVTGLAARKLLLQSAGHRVFEEGIRFFQAERVDFVVLGYCMSGMKGTTVASELKAINASVPIVVLSGMSNFSGEADGLFDQWLAKGSHGPEEFLACIKTLLERRPA